MLSLTYLSGSENLGTGFPESFTDIAIKAGLTELFRFVGEKVKKMGKSGKISDEILHKHTQIVFGMYTQWANTDFIQNLDLTSFDPDNLRIDIVEQIIPPNPSKSIRTTLQEKAILHLNSPEYLEARTKMQDIIDLQNTYNEVLHEFVGKCRSDLSNLVNEKGYTPDKESLNMIFRLVLFYINTLRPPVHIEYRLKHLRLEPINFEILESYISVRLTNPFPQKEEALLGYIRQNHEQYNLKIDEFRDFEGNLKNAISSFQHELKLIVQNTHEGLKGACDVELLKP